MEWVWGGKEPPLLKVFRFYNYDYNNIREHLFTNNSSFSLRAQVGGPITHLHLGLRISL